MRYKFLIVAVISLVFLSACENGQKNNHEITLIEPDSEGAKTFKKFCSACHAPPRIASHKAGEWLNIVKRMNHHRKMKAYSQLNESEKDILITYLKKHSAK